MDIPRYFQSVLSTSYMKRILFKAVELEKASDASKNSKKKGDTDFVGARVGEDIQCDRLANETVDALAGKLSDRDKTEAEKNGLEVLLVPYVLHDEQDSYANCDEALLVVPATLEIAGRKKGCLCPPDDLNGGKHPWIPRELLEEGYPEQDRAPESSVFVGKYENFKTFASNNRVRRDAIMRLPGRKASWSAYAQYCIDLYDNVFDRSENELKDVNLSVEKAHVYAFVDTSVNASAGIEALYESIGKKKKAGEPLPLYDTLTEWNAREQELVGKEGKPDYEKWEEAAKHAKEHRGAASREYPLAESQRLALWKFGDLPNGEVLAVSGPPGTGKTTLLQSIVADLLVDRALRNVGGHCVGAPIIVCASTNNQAVTNIIDAFGKDIKQEEGESLFRRWLPDVDMSGGQASFDKIQPLHGFGVYSPSGSKKDDAKKAGYLLDEVSRYGDSVYKVCSKNKYIKLASGVFLDQAAAYLGSVSSSLANATQAVLGKLEKIDSLRIRAIDAAAENRKQVLVNCLEELGREAGSNLEKLEELKGQIEAYCGLDPSYLLKIVDEWLDWNVRSLEFWLAVHYFEGSWLYTWETENKNYKKNSGGDDGKPNKNSEEDVRQYHSELAYIMPISVMTLFRLPRQFMHKGQTGKGKSLPLFGEIDLLVVDESGQVDTAVGAAAFALAKRAVVVGDVDQLAPVWNLPPEKDKSIARDFAEGENFEDVWKLMTEKGLTASEPSSLMMAAQASCLWKYKSDNKSDTLVERESPKPLMVGREIHEETPRVGGLFLSEHRRCVKSIIQYCNDLVYEGRLEPKREDKTRVDNGLPTMGFCPVDGKAQPSGTSKHNPDEAKAIVAWIERNITRIWDAYNEAGKTLEPGKIIAVVTPFSAQARTVRREFKQKAVTFGGKKHQLKDIIRCGTAHKMQGAECPVVLFSLVYDGKSNAGFVEGNPNLMNVAVSRAKDSFIVFGNESLLANADSEDNGVLDLLKKYCFENRVEAPQVKKEKKSVGAPRAEAKKKRGKTPLVVVGKCPLCGRRLVKQPGRYGEFIGCEGYSDGENKCTYTRSIKKR